ncbi:capsid protein [Escherichia coli]|nr:capsid protein [Escherichia coli]EEY5692677.1 capsid protein [Escherichia coli]EFA5261260.1 capsid protein [Escherichia coli]EFB2547292.1 capsid protein [Escherichia coli]EFB9289215.1 capsid protein [Escherichia coli]
MTGRDDKSRRHVVCRNVLRLAGELLIVRVLNDFQPLQILRAN